VIDILSPQIVRFDGLDPPVKKALRRMGYPASAIDIPPEIQAIIDEMLELTTILIKSAGMFRILKVSAHGDSQVSFENTSFTIKSKNVAKMLCKSDYVGLFMVTIGPQLEDEVSALFEQGETTRGFILDAIGSETADEAARKMHKDVLLKLAKNNGYSITPRFSPGYGDWPLTVQEQIREICDGGQIGVSVNKQSLMIPRKSVSAVSGLVKI